MGALNDSCVATPWIRPPDQWGGGARQGMTMAPLSGGLDAKSPSRWPILKGLGVVLRTEMDRDMTPNDLADRQFPPPVAANDNFRTRTNPGNGALHLSLSGADMLISHFPGGVSLGLVTGHVRCGLGLSRAEAEALAYALLEGALAEEPLEG